MPAVIDKSFAATATATGATLSPTCPSTAQPGDLLLVLGMGYGGVNFSLSIAGGGGAFTQVGTTIADATNGHNTALFAKYVVASDVGAVITVTAGGGAGNIAAAAVVVRGVQSGLSLASLTVTQSSDVTKDATATVTAVTTTADNSLALLLTGFADTTGPTTLPTFAANANMTLIGQTKSTGTSGKNHGVAVASRWVQTAGTTGAENGAFSGGTTGTALNYNFLLALPPRAATIYYVDATSGSDTNDGLQAVTPWQTLAKLAAQVLVRGDSVKFASGQSYAGVGIQWDNTLLDSTAASPVTFTVTTPGVATISPTGTTVAGFYFWRVGAIVMDSLKLVGTGSGTSTYTYTGVEFYTDWPAAANVQHPGITFTNCEISGFFVGLKLGGDYANPGTNTFTAGYASITVQRVRCHDNVVGMLVYGPSISGNYTHGPITLESSDFGLNTGVSTTFGGYFPYMNGCGANVSQCNGGAIRYNRFHHNGGLNDSTNGPSGLITYEVNSLQINTNEADHNASASGGDGNGFGFDYASQSCLIERNYSHDNGGGGFVLAQRASKDTHQGNHLRYNISENDGRTPGVTIAGIFLYNGGTVTAMQNNFIYNNTVYGAQNLTSNYYCFWQESDVTSVRVFNNLFVAAGTAGLVRCISGVGSLIFNTNVFYSIAGGSAMTWGSATHTNDITTDPKLNAVGSQGTLGSVPANPGASVVQYKLTAGSPCIDAGINGNALYGITLPTTGFFGASVPNGSAFDIGANEYVPQSSAPVVGGPPPRGPRGGMLHLLRYQEEQMRKARRRGQRLR